MTKTFGTFLAIVIFSLQSFASSQALKWESFEIGNDQTGHALFEAAATGKIQNQNKKVKIRAEYTLPVEVALNVVGRNPTNGNINDILPLGVAGPKSLADVPKIFGTYQAKMTAIEPVLGVMPAFYKTEGADYYLQSVVSRIPGWGDLFRHGRATLTVLPAKEGQAQVHWYKVEKGNKTEITQPQGVELPTLE